MKYLVMLPLMFSALTCFAVEPETDTEAEFEADPLTVFVAGNYIVVGKAPDSNKTYHGKLSITNTDGKLSVVRNINGAAVKGSAAIESALSGETKVLRIRFTEKSKGYEESCLVSGDLDNYARISCYLYPSDNKTSQPGMEVFFHEPAAE